MVSPRCQDLREKTSWEAGRSGVCEGVGTGPAAQAFFRIVPRVGWRVSKESSCWTKAKRPPDPVSLECLGLLPLLPRVPCLGLSRTLGL